ncbi:MAG TPA: hypothetical protein VFG20_08335, partial [Planctomycetaceae bacterium]|nr:hypothetical protein [Planctomycetaceae bacterium]
AIAFLCDQHRLQPWAWQFFILALLIALADKPVQWHGWQWLTISIYFYSALSKFDAGFLHDMGLTFAETAFGGVFARKTGGLPTSPSSIYLLNYAVPWLFPLGELAVAVLLAFPRSRAWGMYAAIIMHGFLLQILGPFGLNHSHGVLAWNVFFILQGVTLFMPLRRAEDDSETAMSFFARFRYRKPASVASVILMTCVLIWPATAFLGLCDPWLAWEVYVPPRASAWVRLHRFVRGRERQLYQASVLHPSQGMGEYPIRDWSLQTLHVPDYPHLRSTVAATLELAERFDSGDISMRLYHRKRWPMGCYETGDELRNADEIHAYARGFWFNAYPTSMYRRAARERVLKHDG